MNKKIKKMIAPIIISLVMIIYFVFIGSMGLLTPEIPLIGRILFIIAPFVLAGVMVYVLAERINEIRSGEEDDLSKY